MSEPLAVGLVGAGPWARMVHAPMLAAGPETRLAGIWARRPEASAALATQNGTQAVERIEELYERSDAIAFSVPPDVQAELAPTAARAGCALLLEKPIAADLDAAERLVDAIAGAGVVSLVALSWRYTRAVRDFLEAAARFEAIGATGRFVSGSFLPGSVFATPWRLERGPLLDLGPHVIDLLDAALGPVASLHARGDLRSFVTLQLEHASGVVSSAVLSAGAGLRPTRCGVELYGPEGVLEVDCNTAIGPDAFACLRAELARTVAAGGGHVLDARRGLYLQRLIGAAEAQLGGAAGL